MVFDEQGDSQNVSWSAIPEEGKGIGIFPSFCIMLSNKWTARCDKGRHSEHSTTAFQTPALCKPQYWAERQRQKERTLAIQKDRGMKVIVTWPSEKNLENQVIREHKIRHPSLKRSHSCGCVQSPEESWELVGKVEEAASAWWSLRKARYTDWRGKSR